MRAMTEQIVNRKRKEALAGLLDDPAPIVQEALKSEFKRLGTAGRLLLQSILMEAEGEQRRCAESLLESIYGPDPSRMLMEFIQSLQYELESGLILINRVINPDLDVNALREQLDALAARCTQLLVHPLSPLEQCKVINRVLFHEEGFRGELEWQGNPRSSCLGKVLEEKKGSPSILTSIYILVAQRIGLDLEPIALPGQFMVGCFKMDWPVYIDPFQNGRTRSLEEMYAMLVDLEIEPEMHHLAPSPVGEVLYRICGELAGIYDRRGQVERAGIFKTCIRSFEETHQQKN